jgi:hypothetical protein
MSKKLSLAVSFTVWLAEVYGTQDKTKCVARVTLSWLWESRPWHCLVGASLTMYLFLCTAVEAGNSSTIATRRVSIYPPLAKFKLPFLIRSITFVDETPNDLEICFVRERSSGFDPRCP